MYWNKKVCEKGKDEEGKKEKYCRKQREESAAAYPSNCQCKVPGTPAMQWGKTFLKEHSIFILACNRGYTILASIFVYRYLTIHSNKEISLEYTRSRKSRSKKFHQK